MFKWLANIASKCYLSERHVPNNIQNNGSVGGTLSADSTGISLLEPSKICRDGFPLNKSAK